MTNSLKLLGEYVCAIGGKAVVGGPVSIHKVMGRTRFRVVIEISGIIPPEEEL